MVAYHCDANIILTCPFKSRKDQHRLAAYNAIMTRLKRKGLTVDLQIFNNEASAAYKQLIGDEWGAKFQLVPPNIHCRNAAERAIRTFKAHFWPSSRAQPATSRGIYGTFWSPNPKRR